MIRRFDGHLHTTYSNIRLLDCINKPDDLVNKAIEIGLCGIAITDHESLSAHAWISRKQEELIKQGSDFKIAYGNEIYLTDSREMDQQYYHCILIAKDATGHKMMRELSSQAWINLYYDRGMRRVPTLKSELKAVVEKYGCGHLICTTACLGGELSTNLLGMINSEIENDEQSRMIYKKNICSFIKFMKSLFKDDFYLEVAPGRSEDQIKVNSRMGSLADAFKLKIVCFSDAHYLNKEDRWVHKAYLTSKSGEREVDSFYEYAYLQSDDEVRDNLRDTNLDYDTLVSNSYEIYDKIQPFSLFHNQQVTQVEVPNYPPQNKNSKYPTLNYLYSSKDPQDRYWVNYCVDKLKEKNLCNDTYLSRLEEEADIQKTIGESLGTNIFAYPIFLQHYIDLFWECGSTVGAGRGSSCSGLNHWLLGVTQLDPILHSLPYWRFLNKDRQELPDIDLDLCPSKRPMILDKIREERGQLGCVQVCTFGTETSKSAVQTACRGYRSSANPNGIDSDTSKYIASLIPSERGFVWSIHDVVYGNPEKDRKPVRQFIQEVDKFPGLLEIILKIEGLVKQSGIHASGVVFPDGDDPYDMSAFMRAPDGTIVTQFSLHDAEYCGLVKIDALVTEVQDMICECVKMLQEHNFMDSNLTLRECYNKYLHPDVLPVKDKKIWEAMHNNQVLKCFQFEGQVGEQAMKLLKPMSPVEMANVNSVMRLMATEKGGETPADRYARLKNDIGQWYREMRSYGLTQDEQKVLEKYYLPEYGTPAQQESMMLILMDENICGFTLKEANGARKICAKKQMDKIQDLKKQVYDKAKSPQLGKYVWDTAIMPEMGYSFSLIHSLAYSFIGIQTAYLSTYYPRVFWNAAVLRVESGLESDANSDYKKIAKAVCDISSKGIQVHPIDINKSQYAFEPDAETNSIIYGMKALNGVNGERIDEIISNRPYTSFADFMLKCNVNKTVALSLIKAGAFDCFDERKNVMDEYLRSIGGLKTKVTMQNFQSLVKYNLIPQQYKLTKSLFNFNKSLKSCKFVLDDRHYNFYEKHFDVDDLIFEDGIFKIEEKKWKKLYDDRMKEFKQYLKDHQLEMVLALNSAIMAELYADNASGTYSTWEMESMGFYCHPHEMLYIDRRLYNVVQYNSLPENPEIEKTFRDIPIYALNTIMGTVIAKDDTKSTISLLTVESGVINVKFNRESYAYYNKRISEPRPDGSKRLVEDSWFSKGTLLMITGMRRNDVFFAKKYKNTQSELLYRVTNIRDNGTCTRTSERYGEE